MAAIQSSPHRHNTKPADFSALVPLINQTRTNLDRIPSEVSGDTGFASEANITAMQKRKINAYFCPGRVHHGSTDPTAGRVLKRTPLMQAMTDKIRRAGTRSRYRLRKQVVEPVFGQEKQARGEWVMVCTVHNLLKLHNAVA